MPHSQPTALQQTVCKFYLDPQYHISHWGSTILGDSMLRAPMLTEQLWRTWVDKSSNDITKLVNTSRPRQNGRHVADDISSAFSWMKIFEFRLKFHWIMFLTVNWQYGSIGSDDGLAPTRRQAIIWTNDGQVWWRIYASLGLNELSNLITIKLWANITKYTVIRHNRHSPDIETFCPFSYHYT